jgi:long-chain acyl-CoA synthetase
MSYGQLARDSDAFAAALTELGVRHGDRVALVVPNCPQFLVAEMGAWKAGAIASPINPTYTEREVEAALQATGAQTVVTLTPFYGRVKDVQPHTAVRNVIATSIKEHLPPALRILFTLFKEKQGGHRISLRAGDHWLQDLLRKHRNSPPPAIAIGPDDAAVILASGGTTGTPKGVVGLHRHYVAAGLQLYEWTKSAKRPWVDTIMLPLPLFHVYANVGVQPLAFIGPNPISLVPNPRDIDDLLKTIRQYSLPSSMASQRSTRDPQSPRRSRRQVDLSSIKLCFSGSAALMAETKREFERLTGARIVEGYSLTEGMMACCVNPVRGTNKLGRLACRCPTSKCASSTLTIRSVKWAWTKSARCCCVHRSTWSSTGTIPRRRPRR